MTTPRLALTPLVSGQAIPETNVNEAVRWLEQGASAFSFKSKTVAAQPGSPADGDCYLLTGSPTGANWSGQAGKIAQFVNTAWEFKTAQKGMVGYVVDADIFIGYNSAAAWITLSAGAITVDNDTTLAGDSTTNVPSQHAVKTAIANAVTGVLSLAGATDCSANPNYPAASKGAAYEVTVAGKIGGASGVAVAIGDVYFALANNAGGTQAGVGSSWDVLVHASVAAGGGLLAANNLSDVASAVAAKDNVSKKSTDIASAATTDLSTATGDYVNITGTTTITGLGTCAAGIERTLHFAGALTLTYNATSLILPTSANIVTAAGDVAIFRSLGSGNWQCVGYQLASGQALAAGSTTFATTAEVQAGTNGTHPIASDHLAASAAPQTLTDGATISWDMSLGYNAQVTITAARTLGTPTNRFVGQTYTLAVIQDGTGSRTMTWPAGFDWGTTGAPTLTTTASKVDQITLFCTDAATPKFRAYLSGKGFAS